MRRYAYISCALLVLWSLLTSLFSIGLNDELYDIIQKSENVNEITCGLTDEERMTMNRETAMYLAGRTEGINGLSERARLHMGDVKNLFSAARYVMYAVTLLMIVFTFIARRKSRKQLVKAFFVSTGIYVLLALVIAGLSVIDFGSLFTVFHKILFTNDLWLLDPAEDTLIRILPQGFFVKMSVIIAVGAFVRCVIAGVIYYTLDRLTGRLSES